MANLSPIVSKIIEIANFRYTLQSPYIDGRKNGYRMKFPHTHYDKLSLAAIEKLKKLPHVTKVGFNTQTRNYYGENFNLCVWVDKRPKEIKIK
jgi:phosphoribosylaminoimidazole (AIR) synthetase